MQEQWKKYKDTLKELMGDKVPLSDESSFERYAEKAIGSRDSLLRCAEEFGTPLYALDLDMLKDMAEGFVSAFRKRLDSPRFFYAFKSNDLPYMIDTLKGIGFDADVASGMELNLALKLGFRNIIYTAPVKKEEELRLALKHHDRVIINVDNLDELGDIIRLNKRKKKEVRVSFRLRAGWAKFGLETEELLKAVRAAEEGGLSWCGVHFHTSWNKEAKAYQEKIEKVAGFLKRNFGDDKLSGLRFIDIGGGFLTEGSGTKYSATGKGRIIEMLDDRSEELDRIYIEKVQRIDTFAEKISQAVKMDCTGPLKHIEIWIEPGRYISSLPTYILLKVASVRKHGVFVDGGINLIGGAGFDIEYFPVVNLSDPSTEIQKGKIYGPLCDPDDHFGSSYFGKKCKRGDILAVMHQGAYTFSTAWRWQQPVAAYAAFSGNRVLLAKERESFTDRYRGCKTANL